MAGADACLGMAATDYPDWLRWRFELTLAYDDAVEAKNRAIPTWTDQLAAWQLRRGSVEISSAGGRLNAGPGQWVLFPPGLARRHRFTEDAAIRSLRVAISDAAGQPPGLGQAPLMVAPGDGTELASCADRVLARLPSGDWRRATLAPQTWASLQSSVLAFATCAMAHLGIVGAAPPVEPRVLAAQRLLLERPSPAALPWDRLRTATGLSRPQLDRLFAHHCGGSVRSWIEGRLLTDACRALEDRSDAVKSVAMRLGFGDASHFCRWFRSRTGASPQDWRRHAAV